MDLGIEGRRALVAAASSGLGLASAEALAAEGAAVVLLARDPGRLAAAADRIAEAAGRRPETHSVDVANGDALGAAIAAVEAGGPVDILVTNSGGPPAKLFLETTPEDWQQAVDLMLMSTVRLVHGVLPGMLARGWGRIVCITSVAAKEPVENLVLSNAIRAGVTGLAKSLSREVGANGVLVNTIAPGFHDTPALDRLVAKLVEQGAVPDAEAAYEGWRRAVPVGRIGDTAAFGRMVAFLASDACDYLTGTNLPVDGGRTRATF